MDFNLQEYYDDLNLENDFPDLKDVNKNNIITLWELRKMHEDSSLDYFVIDDMHLEENLDDDIELISWEILSPIDQKKIQDYYIPFEDIAYYENQKAISWNMYNSINNAIYDILNDDDLTKKQTEKLEEKILKKANKFIDSIYKKYWNPLIDNKREYFDF